MINKPRPGNWSPTDKTNTSLSFESQTSLNTRHTDQIMKHTETRTDVTTLITTSHNSIVKSISVVNWPRVWTGLHPCIMERVLLPEVCVWVYWSPEPHQLMSGEGDDRPQNTDPGPAEAEAAVQCRGCSEAARGRGPSLMSRPFITIHCSHSSTLQWV